MAFKVEIDLSSIEIKLKTDLDYLKEYIHFNIKKLNERNAKLNNLLNEEKNEQPQFSDFFEKIYLQDKIRIPTYLYHSTLVSLYSLLEVTLIEICDLITLKTEFPIPLDQISGQNIIGKTRIFLSKVANLNFQKLDTQWLTITQIQKLRNLIIHENSCIKSHSAPSDLLQLIKKFGVIDIENEREYFYLTNPEILFDTILLIESFFEKIIIDIKTFNFFKFEKPEVPIWYFGQELGMNDLPF
nr:hypothetical protein [uncultured Sediminibacterium sp.]